MLKTILIVIGVIFGILVLSMVIFVTLVSSANKPKGNHEQILKSKQQSPQKALIVYQPSISGISSNMAHEIAKGLNDNGYEVTLNNPGDHLTANISEYSIVVFGSPVYAGKTSDAMTNYISKIEDFSKSKFVLYSTGSIPNELKELDVMEKLLNGASAYKKVKFNANAKSGNDKLAYDLGNELSK